MREPPGPADETRLQRLLARALPADGLPGASGSMTVERSCKAPRLTLHVSPTNGYPLGYDLWRVAAVVLIVEPASRLYVDAGMVTAVLGLTPAEGRIAALLGAGHTVRGIASMTRTFAARFTPQRIAFVPSGGTGAAGLTANFPLISG